MLDGELPIEEVFSYTSLYVHQKRRNSVKVSLYPVMTKIERKNAVPTISVFDLEAILIDIKRMNKSREAPSHVMLCMYNAGVAHNILYVTNNMQCCILAGYDEATQTALLIDAHPKMFSRT
uniref:Uncharacterized protein n=1 Tax=Lygus hesperus TaxID=30085 RepID=A0A146LIJ3_LYGHE